MLADFILLFFNLIIKAFLSSDQVENPDFNNAISILQALESDSKSFCFESKAQISNKDVNELSQILAKIKDLKAIGNPEKNEARKIIKEYVIYIQDKNKMRNNIVYELLESECHITSLLKNDIQKAVLLNMRMKQSEIEQKKCGEYLAIACFALKLYDELKYLDTDQKHEVQSLVNIMYYNYEKISYLTQNDHINRSNLSNMTQKFIEKNTNSTIILPPNIVNCLILKSIGFDRRNETKFIDETYRNIIFNLRLDETCEISSLGPRIGELIDAINSSNLNLTTSYINALLDGFESLHRIIKTTNILFLLRIQNNLNKYIPVNNCELNKASFAADYSGVVDQLKHNIYSSRQISDVSVITAIFCVYAEINNHPVSSDNSMMNDLSSIINVYIYLIDTFNQIKRDWMITVLDTVISDSEYIRKNYYESYIYKETIICYLRRYKEKTDQDFSPQLTALGNYLYNQYTFKYCPKKLSYVEEFAKDLSQLLPDFRGSNIFSFRTIEKSVREKVLTPPSIDENVAWIKWYQYDTCFINESTFNYRDIKMGYESVLPNTKEEMMSKIDQRCTMIGSTSKLIDMFNKQIKNNIDQVYKVLCVVKSLKPLLSVNNSENIRNLIETETDKQFKNSKLSQGKKMRLYCEVNSLMNLFPDLTNDFLNELNIYILHLNMDTDSCLYASGAFNSENLTQIESDIKRHPSFENVNKDIIREFILLFQANFTQSIINIVEKHPLSESLLNLLNSSTCSFDYEENIKELISRNLKEKYKLISSNWNPYYIFYKCIELKQIIPSIYTLERNRRLSDSDLEILNEIYQQVIEQKPELVSETEQNIDNIIKEMRNNDKFVNFDNELKILLLSCHTLKIHSQMRDKSKETTLDPNEVTTTTLDPNEVTTTTLDPNEVTTTTVDPNKVTTTTVDPNEITTTTVDPNEVITPSVSTEQSNITSSISDVTTISTNNVTITQHNETTINFTTQVSSTTDQSNTTLSPIDNSTEEFVIISTKETIVTNHSHSTPDPSLSNTTKGINTTPEIITEISSSTNAYDELPKSTVEKDKPISENVRTTKRGSTNYASENDTNETKRPSLSTPAIIGITIGGVIFLSILVFAIIYYLRQQKDSQTTRMMF